MSRSSIPSQIPRRSTSVDNLSQMNRQSSLGRSSSISGRPSSIMGRISMAPNKQERSTQDMIYHISLLLETLEFNKNQNMSIRQLLEAKNASTSTFYDIFSVK